MGLDALTVKLPSDFVFGIETEEIDKFVSLAIHSPVVVVRGKVIAHQPSALNNC